MKTEEVKITKVCRCYSRSKKNPQESPKNYRRLLKHTDLERVEMEPREGFSAERKKGGQVKDKQVLLVKAAKRMRDRKMKGGTLQNKTGNQSKQSITKQEVANASIKFSFFYACDLQLKSQCGC